LQVNKGNTMSTTEMMVGGWTKYHSMTPADAEVFKVALMGFVGVTYHPEMVATQVVAGMNYRYKCMASIPPADVVWEALIDIYKPLTGKPYITGIHRI
jgi:hypothetical protein